MMIHRLSLKLSSLHAIVFTLLFVGVFIVNMFLSNAIVDFFKIPDIHFMNKSDREHSLLQYIIVGVIIVPLLETFFHQKGVYWLLSKVRYFKERNYWIIIISAVVFGLVHFYSVHYIAYGIGCGMILMYAPSSTFSTATPPAAKSSTSWCWWPY